MSRAEPCKRSSPYCRRSNGLPGLREGSAWAPVRRPGGADRLPPVRALRTRRGRRPARRNEPRPAPLRPRASRARTRADLRSTAGRGNPPGGVILEGGAHLGFVTVHEARAAGPGGRVVVFEPNGGVLECSAREPDRERRRRTGRDRPQGAGGGGGASPVLRQGDESSLYEPTGDADPIEVAIVRADEELEGPVDVIKLDVEGAELAALRGMEGFITGGAAAARTVPRVQSGAPRACRIVVRRAGRLAARTFL